MYPYPLFLGISLYDIFFSLGLVAAIVVLSVYSGKKNMPVKVQSFYLNLAIAAIMGGYLSAFLFQAVYNFIENGIFEFKGITFLGGLLGGAATFLAGYKIFAKEDAKKYFGMLVEIAPCGILIAHALGRIGCFFAGCCYGIQTDSFLGVQFPGNAYKVFPTQLFESAFLFIMFGVTTYLFFKNYKFNMILYLLSYGIFRFFIEFIRGDDRGEFFISFLTPSQGNSLLLIIAGLILLYFKLKKKNIAEKKE